MVSAYDQIDPFVFEPSCTVIQMEWNADGTILALINANHELVMLDREGRTVYRETMSLPKEKCLSAFTWAHDGQAIIVAAGGALAVGRLLLGVPSLFNLVTYDLWRFLGSQSRKVDSLPLPIKEKNALRALDHHIIRYIILFPILSLRYLKFHYFFCYPFYFYLCGDDRLTAFYHNSTFPFIHLLVNGRILQQDHLHKLQSINK
uniref:ANAPC4_WD40 domain-containing protein n=1 Tax=Heterorhabditis bacteriophora TaxID=37862 RepID=A0A1I7WVQ1_HETBA